MNMHLESTQEMVAYHQRKLADEFAVANSSTFLRDFRLRVAHILIRVGETLDDRCREAVAPAPPRRLARQG